MREKFNCRDCEKISQPPAPFHAIPRGWAGPSLIAMIAFYKYGQHQPLNRQSERVAREGIDLSLSNLADLIGHACVALAHALIERHVLDGGRLHGDDTTVPASKSSLLNVLEDVGTKTIHYIYDFGDNWQHVIKVEKIDDAIPGAAYPRLVRAIGACPPEDVGDFPRYDDFLEAMADPKHEDHDRMLEWYGGKFDPDEAEIGRILDNFERLAKKWVPKPRKPKAAPKRL